MGDEAASFDGKVKTFRRPFIPPLEDLLLRQAIESDIELDGVKVLSIEFEPFPLGKIGRIEDPVPPVRIVITACPDKDPVMDCGMRGAGLGILGHPFFYPPSRP